MFIFQIKRVFIIKKKYGLTSFLDVGIMKVFLLGERLQTMLIVPSLDVSQNQLYELEGKSP